MMDRRPTRSRPTRSNRSASGDTAQVEDPAPVEEPDRDEHPERSELSSHSTARGAAELARDAQVRMLALTHASSRYGESELRDEARAVFAATEAPRDFDTIEVPFPERAGPTLVSWSERRARERAVGVQSETLVEDDGAGSAPSQTVSSS